MLENNVNKELAQKICEMLDRYSGELDESVRWVKEECSEEEFLDYRSIIAKILTDMLIDIYNPIYRLYPELTPEGLTVPHCHNSCKIHSKVGFGKPNAAIKKKEQIVKT